MMRYPVYAVFWDPALVVIWVGTGVALILDPPLIRRNRLLFSNITTRRVFGRKKNWRIKSRFIQKPFQAKKVLHRSEKRKFAGNASLSKEFVYYSVKSPDEEDVTKMKRCSRKDVEGRGRRGMLWMAIELNVIIPRFLS